MAEYTSWLAGTFDGASDLTWAEQTYVRLSGNVTDQNDIPARRAILIYHADDLSAIIASTDSDPTTGDWSIDIAGTVGSTFTVIAVGTRAENSQIYRLVVAQEEI